MSKNKIYLVIALVLLFCMINIGLFWLAHSTSNHEGDESISVPPTPEGIRTMLTHVLDPEIGLNIVDLGLVRDIEVKPDKKAVITIVFTSPFCPLMDSIVAQIANKVKKINGIHDVEVKIDKTVAWNKNMMTGKGKQKLEEHFP